LFRFIQTSDDESPDKSQQANRTETGGNGGGGSGGSLQGPLVGPNPFLEPQASVAAIEYKKGYVMRKCCFESNYKKSEYNRLNGVANKFTNPKKNKETSAIY
jgi:hypothetical protein